MLTALCFKNCSSDLKSLSFFISQEHFFFQSVRTIVAQNTNSLFLFCKRGKQERKKAVSVDAK